MQGKAAAAARQARAMDKEVQHNAVAGVRHAGDVDKAVAAVVLDGESLAIQVCAHRGKRTYLFASVSSCTPALHVVQGRTVSCCRECHD